MNPSLFVRISSPKALIFNNKAFSVSSVNSAGAFDILPLHANFITFIENKPIIIRIQSGEKIFRFPFAIIYAANNQVNIYTDIQIQFI